MGAIFNIMGLMLLGLVMLGYECTQPAFWAQVYEYHLHPPVIVQR
jgi:hypothetical protein